MKLVFTIAWRNIQRHRRKSAVIGVILFLGAAVMTVGNGVLSGMDRGLADSIINRFTGQVVVLSRTQERDGVIITAMGKSIEVIKGYAEIKKVLDSQDYIARYLPVGRGITMVLNEAGDMGFTSLIGADFEAYQSMFLNNVQLVEGRFLKKGERGILITEGNRKEIFLNQNFWIQPEGAPVRDAALPDEAKEHRDTLDVRESVVLMGASSENASLDILAPVKGVVRYEYLDKFWRYFNIIDMESFREAFQYVTASDAKVKLDEKKSRIMESENLDYLFGGSVISSAGSAGGYDVRAMVKRDRKAGDAAGVDSGAYNVVFIKLKKGVSIDGAVDRLEKALKNTGGRAVSWKKAAGEIAELATIIRGALFGFVMFIFFVAIIIIMNTLTMTALERVSELGMMRAVGAQKGFISRMFLTETFILSFAFGGAGMVFGIVIVAVLNALGITTDNSVLQLLFGGDVFSPFIDFRDVIVGIAELSLVTVLAAIYPIRVTRRITPLEAIARD